MNKSYHTFQFDDEITRVLKVEFDSFSDLNFFYPKYDFSCFERICNLYQNFTVKKYPNVFGTIVMFTLPEGIVIPFENINSEYGECLTDFSIVKVNFLNNIRLKKGKLVFKDKNTETFFHYLQENNYLRIVKGNLNTLTFLPIGRKLGYLSTDKKYSLKVNSNFFVMDKWDCSSVFDEIGTPVGLCVKDGKVLNPPLFNRETLVCRNGNISIEMINLNHVKVKIDDSIFDSTNAMFITRPKYRKSPKGGFDIMIVKNQIVGIKKGGNSTSLSSGFILHLQKEIPIKSKEVTYLGLEDIDFAIQVGNSSMINGVETKRFISKFYNVYKPWTTSFAPSLYPLDYEKARAPRIILGSDEKNKPILLWIEGQGKFGYRKGIDSCGASLVESTLISKQLGLYQAIHLDGGGSAQILLNNEKDLLVSDRDPITFEEVERGIGLGLYIL